MPGIISWPAVVGVARESWDTVITSDFLPTIMEILSVERPSAQRDWALDGTSVMPILREEAVPPRCIGHNFNSNDGGIDKGFRCGKWKLVLYCNKTGADQSCGAGEGYCKGKALLYDLEADIGERNDLSASEPEVLKSMLVNESLWFKSIERSIGKAESNCPPSVVPKKGIAVPTDP